MSGTPHAVRPLAGHAPLSHTFLVTVAAFEWDDKKAAENHAKHAITFEAAVQVFLDENRIELTDVRKPYGEQRVNVTGMVDGICITVTFTIRAEICRIISARPASRKERRIYAHHP